MVEDLEADPRRWPLFTHEAMTAGFRSVHALALRCHDQVIGALNLFRTTPGALDEDDLVAKANSTIYGLVAGVWTSDVARAHRVAHALKAGTVYVNCYHIVDAVTPWGGYKQSGWGRELGPYALDLYTELKNVIVDIA